MKTICTVLIRALSVSVLLAGSVQAEALRYFGQTPQSYQSRTDYGNNPAAGHYIQSGDANIYYETYGTGAPVIVLHGGLAGSIGEMGQFIDRLAQTRQVIAISTRGHGKSDIGTQTPDYAVKAADVRRVLRAASEQPAVILGFSDGAYTAYQFARDYPQDVSKIIAIGAGTWEKGWRDFGMAYEDFVRLDPDYWRQQDTIRPQPRETARWYKQSTDFYQQYELTAADLSGIQTPVLVLAGEDDQNAPLDSVIAAYKALPNADLAIIPNAPHSVFQSNFPAVWAVVETFLQP